MSAPSVVPAAYTTQSAVDPEEAGEREELHRDAAPLHEHPPAVEVAERLERPPPLPGDEHFSPGGLLDPRRGAAAAECARELRWNPVRVEVDRAGHYRALPNTAVRS